MAVYSRPNTAIYWMSYTDENGKRWRVSTGTSDTQLAESIYQKAVAEVALKKASQLASSVQHETATKLGELAAAEVNLTPGGEAEPDLPARTAALEKAVGELHQQFNKLWVMFLGFEINQKKLANLLVAAVESVAVSDSPS